MTYDSLEAQVARTAPDERVPFLLSHLRNPFAMERPAVAKLLGEVGSEEVVEPLIAVLSNLDDGVRAQAAASLGRIGDLRAVKPLIHVATHDERGPRISAMTALGILGDRRAVGPLIQALSSDDWAVRLAAIRALGQLGDPHASDALEPFLKDPLARMRQAAATALGRVGGPEAIPKVAALLDDDGGDSPVFYDEYPVAESAVHALGNLGAVHVLVAALEHPNSEVREAAVMELGRLKVTSATGPLIRVVHEDDDPYVRASATTVLASVGEREAMDAVRAARRAKSPLVARTAEAVLSKKGVAP